MLSDSSPWSKEYRVFGIPRTLKPYPDKPVYEILADTARKYKKNGLIQNNFKISYPAVQDHVLRLATALHRLGLKKGDRVATILPTSIQFFVADYAISRAGLVHIPSSSLEPPANLHHKFSEGTPKALICLDSYLDVARDVARGSSVEHVIVTQIEDYSEDPPQHRKGMGAPNWHRFMELIHSAPPEPPEYTFDVEKDLETLLFTGGTTGLPKGCMLTHRNIYANALQNVYGMGQSNLLLTGAVSVLLGLPFFHSYGHMLMHTMTLFGWNQLLVVDPRDTRAMVQMIQQYRPLIQIGVPTQFMKLCDEELKGFGMLGISGSAPLPPSAQEEYEKKSGGGIMEGYGLSEMSPTTHINSTFLLRVFGGRIPVTINSYLLRIPGNKAVVNWFLRLLGPKVVGYCLTRAFYLLTLLTRTKKDKERAKPANEKRGTIGIPFPDTEIKVIDTETGKPLTWEEMRQGKRGEMLLGGPQRMLGYWPTPGQGIDADGYIHTSDVIKIDENGYFYIVDRTKDMIIVSGFKVYSREIDDILFGHGAVEMAATIGVPDPQREGSELVVVYVQPKPQFKDQLTAEEIIAYLRERAAKYAIPKKVFIVDEIPLTEVQKMNKKQLRMMAIETLAAA